jgi:hypothetical protein
VTEALDTGRFPFNKQLFIVDISDSRTERKSQQMHQGKDMIGETCGNRRQR